MTSPTPGRKPGRPKGSSRYRDSTPALLRQVAERILACSALTTRAAILQVLVKNDPAALRRLQGKFNREQEVAAARAREEARVEAARRQAADWQGVMCRIHEWARQLQPSPELLKYIREFQLSPELLKHIRGVHLSPELLKHIQGINKEVKTFERMMPARDPSFKAFVQGMYPGKFPGGW